MLGLQPIKNATRVKDIFQKVKNAFTGFDLKWGKLSVTFTDRAPSVSVDNDWINRIVVK